MKLLFVLLLALVIFPGATKADVNAQTNEQIRVHNIHQRSHVGSVNKLFTPLGKAEQHALSKANPIEKSGYDTNRIRRVSWVKVNMAEIDALKAYAIDILAEAKDDPKIKSWELKNYEGNNIHARVKNHLDFPIDINFNFFEDLESNELFLEGVTKTVTISGDVFWRISLSQRHRALSTVEVKLRGELSIYTRLAGFRVQLEQVNNSDFKITLEKEPRLVEEDVLKPGKKSHREAENKASLQNITEPLSILRQTPPRVIELLVLFDKYSDKTAALENIVSDGTELINTVLLRSKINATVTIAAVDDLPTSVCGGAGNCQLSFKGQLNEVIQSDEVLKLRLEHKADAVVLIRSTAHGDLNFRTDGMATQTDPNDPLQANKAYALVYQHAIASTFAHEVGHLLGAGHSQYNSSPGDGYAKARITFYDDMQNTPYHKDAVWTLMAYEYLCKQELNAINANSPGKSQQKCIRVEQFSGPDEYIPPWTDIPVMLGSSAIANRYRVEDVTQRAPGWSEEIINHKPVPAINFVSVPGVAGQPHCFNGIGTTDPDGDDIIRFYWIVRKVADWNRLKEAEYATKESTFCWTPSTSQIGEYRILLSVRDAHGEDNIIGESFFVRYDPDYISAPELYLYKENGYYITLSWSIPTVGNVSYYDLEKSTDNSTFIHVATSWDTTEVFAQYNLSSDNYFRVRGCTSSDKCGAWSNVLHYRQGSVNWLL